MYVLYMYVYVSCTVSSQYELKPTLQPVPNGWMILVGVVESQNHILRAYPFSATQQGFCVLGRRDIQTNNCKLNFNYSM